jgi:para-nitrobenzyl esterase
MLFDHCRVWTSAPARIAAVAACAVAVLMNVAAHAAAMIRIPGDPVRTTGGMVAGTRLASGVHAYLGVPFAQPPVGNLRWQPPQPLRWDGIWNADRKGPECIQVLRQHDINHYFGEEATAEDCLFLNVWTPANAKAGTKLPVIVFIYGGGSTIGSSGMAHYDGENVARHGAVYVNFNYRAGMLWLMAHPELTREQGGHSGNYA